MFGAFLRAAPAAALGALAAAALAKVMSPLTEVAQCTSTYAGDPLCAGLVAATNNFLLVIGLGIMLGLIARAAVEGRLGGI
jgi:hypothetical protein